MGWFIIGLIIGVPLGLFLAALMVMSGGNNGNFD